MNGLLLLPQYDAAFDSGLITFDTNGLIVISPTVSIDELARAGIEPNAKLRFIHTGHGQYLDQSSISYIQWRCGSVCLIGHMAEDDGTGENSQSMIFKPPSDGDWSYESIRAVTLERVRRLDEAPEFEHTIRQLSDRLPSRIRGEPGTGKRFKDGIRAIVEIPVTPTVYDWFFNSRNGYRAAFWNSPEDGIAANDFAVERMLPSLLDGRTLNLGDIDLADVELSLGSPGTKLWIKERFEQVPDFYKTYITDPALPKLDVRRWFEVQDGMAERGAAPYPPEACCIIEWKGNVIVDGEPRETKDRQERARHIQERGWT